METISSVKFATLHNEKTIFYSHSEHVSEVLSKINSLNHEVILITGSCDHPNFGKDLPKNVKYHFAQNALTVSDNIIPIPIGLRNSFQHHILNQFSISSDASYEDGKYSSKKLTDVYLNNNTIPSKFIYSNFSATSNLGYRSFIMNLCISIPHIDHEDCAPNSISEYPDQYDSYISKILDHESTFCPIGNGLDTHRIWEVLYCKRIPITINANSSKTIRISTAFPGESFHIPPQRDEYAIYSKLYSQLPIVILDNYKQLFDEDYLKSQIEDQKNKKYDSDLIDFNYWNLKF